MKPQNDLIGIGIGPFNLSLAALIGKVPGLSSQFFEQKKNFSWHNEIMFRDSVMQTSYLKDLVTPVDPTNPHSFLNYLVEHGLFYSHLNTGRSSVSRREFEIYCQWVVSKLGPQLTFDTAISEIDFKDGAFHVKAHNTTFTSQHLCIGTGLSPWLPDFAAAHLGPTCIHAKSAELGRIDLTGKRVAVIGGGQTGLEVFRNAFKGLWGQPARTCLVSRRHNLEPLDESPFTNEYFSPGYARDFYQVSANQKPAIVQHQRFASDGNTPMYLQDLYNELYQLKHIDQKGQDVKILPQRQLMNMESDSFGHKLYLFNSFTGITEQMQADVVIFCTGFRSNVPKCLTRLQDKIFLDQEKRFILDENFSLNWEHTNTNKIYAVNFGRHIHGISEPQTSLMAWRSGKIINDITGKTIYPAVNAAENFTQHGTFNDL